jgi:cell division protein FtsL
MTLEQFSEKWITPSSLMILIGAIIWGVQLNAAVLDLAREISKLEQRVAQNTTINVAQNESLIKLGTIVDGIEKRIQKAEHHVIEHERDSEIWKRRIQANEARLQGR